ESHPGRLALVLGKDISGEPVLADLAKMPHLLIAGTTGSGKSVGINTMILSILYQMPSDRCKFIMVDPKMLELSVYDGIPHLLAPVVTDPKKAIVALKWTVREMEDRYRRMSKIGVRNIAGYNERAREAQAKGEHFERTVQTGVDVITGTIKANFPTRISFQVTSRIDSRTIMGEQGAEQLLGNGDMLYMAGGGRITRLHGPFVSDGEVETVAKFLREQGEPQYL